MIFVKDPYAQRLNVEISSHHIHHQQCHHVENAHFDYVANHQLPIGLLMISEYPQHPIIIVNGDFTCLIYESVKIQDVIVMSVMILYLLVILHLSDEIIDGDSLLIFALLGIRVNPFNCV